MKPVSKEIELSCCMFSKLFDRLRGITSKPEQNAAPIDASFSFIGADIHSHFIPGIDDGAKTMEDSMFLIRSMLEMGYKKITTTPHIMIDNYPNTRDTILGGLDKVRAELKNRNIEVEVNAAAEYYIDEYFYSLIEKKEQFLTVNKNEVLVEFSMLYEPPGLKKALFEMQTSGYRPILAHPERYSFMHQDIEKYYEMRDRGCLLQLNLLSILGYYGANVKKIALALLEAKLYDYCGTDAHNDKHIAGLRNLLRSPEYNLIADYQFLNSKLCF